jgi:4-amino-4-deoxy-L-arabinose transferase-like glycosyltransferase
MRRPEELTAIEVPDRVQRIDRADERISRRLLFLLILIAAVYLGTAGSPRLFDQIDGQYAGAAREMLARGDWLTPTQDGIPRLQKPPLVYWCEMVSLRLFGENEFAARLPVILTTLAWFFVTATLAGRLSGRRIHGLCTGLILSTFFGTYLFTHLVMPEPFSALFLVCTLYAFVCALQSAPGEAGDRWLLLAWLSIALGTLAKGLHALVIPLVIAAASSLLKKSGREVWRRFLFRPHGWILFFLIVAPWYAVMESRYPGFLIDQLGNEQIGNIINRRWPIDGDRVPLGQFLIDHVGLLFPWSFFLPGVAVALWRSRKDWLEGEWYLLSILLFINFAGILFAKIQDYYLLISWPVIAAGTASFFVSTSKVSRSFFSIPGWLFALVGIAGLVIALWTSGHPTKVRDLANTVAGGKTVWEGIGGISSEKLIELLPVILIAVSAMVLSGLSVIYFAHQNRVLEIVGSCAVLMVVFLLASNWSLFRVEDEFSSAEVASSIEKWGAGEYRVVGEFEANDLTSLFFYLPHSIQWLHAKPEMEFATRNLGIGRELYIDEDRFLALWLGDQRVFLISNRDRLEYWRKVLRLDDRAGTPLAVFGAKMVLMNH